MTWRAFVFSASLAVSPAFADVYLTKDAALDAVFGPNCTRRAEVQVISEDIAKELSDKGLAGEESKEAYFFVCSLAGVPTAYALIDSEIGKHEPITYIVGISPEGKVTKVEVMVFREVRGWEVREKKFVQQFEGKASNDELTLGGQIANVSGATLSSAAMTKGVKRALLLWEKFYGHVKA